MKKLVNFKESKGPFPKNKKCNNIVNNTQVNYFINNYGDEDVSHITRRGFLEIIKKNKLCIPEFIKDVPQNHNVYNRKRDHDYQPYFFTTGKSSRINKYDDSLLMTKAINKPSHQN